MTPDRMVRLSQVEEIVREEFPCDCAIGDADPASPIHRAGCVSRGINVVLQKLRALAPGPVADGATTERERCIAICRYFKKRWRGDPMADGCAIIADRIADGFDPLAAQLTETTEETK